MTMAWCIGGCGKVQDPLRTDRLCAGCGATMDLEQLKSLDKPILDLVWVKCDRCPARSKEAFVRVDDPHPGVEDQSEDAPKRGLLVLTLCDHHAREHRKALLEQDFELI